MARFLIRLSNLTNTVNAGNYILFGFRVQIVTLLEDKRQTVYSMEKLMIPRPSVLVILTSLITGFASALAYSQPASRLAAIDKILSVVEQLYSTEQLVGLQAAVYSGGDIVKSLNLGFADLEHKVKVTDSSRFEVASINKTFTGLALLQLEEDGGIDLDRPIQSYVPEFPDKPEGIITGRLLAGALGGIRHYEENERTPAYYSTHYDDVVNALDLFKHDPLIATPGTKENYSSYGYVLLAAAIQQATNVSYQSYIEESLLKPIKLDNTGFVDVRLPMENRSRNYTFIDPYTREVFDELHLLPTMEHSSNTGAGNMYSTATDLAVFGAQFLKPGFLSANVYQQIYEPHFASDGTATQFSDGWVLIGAEMEPRFLFFGGSYPGSTAILAVYPDNELVVAITTNTWGKNGSNWTFPILNSIGEALLAE
jgi:CubicO group peptidase (beta-lactamase class C family)